ncbi:hypothetical protein Syun_002077 [Stephania yunnanensis]|uniref:C2H2-type domain-containing protein n=1 Tax=Stephania yunnanensis TaxID=152371 RepID=A0AAP0LGW9_9MAGN
MDKKKGSSSSTSNLFDNNPTQDNAGRRDDSRESSDKSEQAPLNQVLSTNHAPHQCSNCTRSFSSSQALGGHQNAHRSNRYSVRRDLLFFKRMRTHNSSSSTSHHRIPYNSSLPNSIHPALMMDTHSSLTPPTLHGFNQYGGCGGLGGLGGLGPFVDSLVVPTPTHYGLDRGHHKHHHRVHAYGPMYWWSTYCNDDRSAQRTVEMQAERVLPAWLTENHENRVAAEIMRSTFNVVDQASGDHHQPLIEFVGADLDGDDDDEVAESSGGGDESGEAESGDGGLDLTLKL